MTKQTLSAGALISLMAILIVPAAGQKNSTNWPGFRGVDAAGIADGFPLPAVWDAPASGNILWKTPVPGLGHSSPIIWGNRLFVAAAVSGSARQDLKVGLYGDIASVKESDSHGGNLHGQPGDLGRGYFLPYSV